MHWDVVMPEHGKGSATTVLIHCGDFTNVGHLEDLLNFNRWLGQQPYDHRLYIWGNHDRVEDNQSWAQALLTNGTCIHDRFYEVDGMTFFGCSYTPEFLDWDFMHNKSQGQRYWQGISGPIDVLVTHGPPEGILDQVDHNALGCRAHRQQVEKIAPRVNCFGHIHRERKDKRTQALEWDNISSTLFINAAIVDEQYRIVREPITIEV